MNKQDRERLGRFLVVCWLVFAASLVQASGRSLVVLPLSHALPDQIVPAIEAVLPDGATVTSYNSQLILQVTPAEQAIVEELLQQIDTVPQQLLISVRTPRSSGTVEQGVSVSGSFAGGRVKVGDDKPGRVVIRSDSASSKQNGKQSVRATEGMPAYIAIGSSVPVTTSRTDRFGNRETVTEYRAADQGFYVTARLAGDQVILDIRQTDDSHGANKIKTLHLSTSVTGELGRWMMIGSTGSTTKSSHQGLVIRSSDASSGTGTIELLVEKL